MQAKRSYLGVPAAALLALVLTACGGATPQDQQAASAAGQPSQQQAAPHQGHHSGTGLELWAVQTGPLGVIVADGAGRVLHRTDADSAQPSTATCTGDCTAIWPPVLVADGEKPALYGVNAALVGTVTRPDGGVQLTLAGWPLYTYSSDDGSLTTTAGDGMGDGGVGAWHAITPDGSPAIRALH